MTTQAADDQYRSLKPDVEALALALFDATQRLLKGSASFLPHGAMLTESGDVRFLLAGPEGFEERAVSALEVLPLLHDGLRHEAAQHQAKGVAVCESVRVTQEGQKETQAIKVLVEHREGLCVALYLPYRRTWYGRCQYGQIFVVHAEPEVCPWNG